MTQGLQILPATAGDLPVILSFIRELADYEKLGHEVQATEAALGESLFGPRPAAEVLIATMDAAPAGFALFFQNYSTFLAKPGVFLEDLFVRPAFRGRGVGRMLLARVAKLAVTRGCGRFEWAVLDWNAPAIGFYKSLGARPLDEWTIFRLTGDALHTLGADELRTRDPL